MIRFLSQLTRFSLLSRIWPWKELLRLQRQCHAHWEFGESCVAYLNHIDKQYHHIRFNDRLYFVGVDQMKIMTRASQANGKAGEYDA
jgi:hypothetical protein